MDLSFTFNRLTLKSPTTKYFLFDSLIASKEFDNRLMKSLVLQKGCLYMMPTIQFFRPLDLLGANLSQRFSQPCKLKLKSCLTW